MSVALHLFPSGTAYPAWDLAACALASLSLLIWLYLAAARGGFWRVRPPPAAPAPRDWPAVVAVVPARDEAEVVGAAMASLVAQDYPGPFHVVLVDDHSTDGTALAALAAAHRAGQSHRLSVVGARALPAGWAGKVWAQAEGLAHVDATLPEADYVWLTDADIGHPPGALRELVALAEHEGRDLVSLMVRLRCESFAEKALIPAFVFFFAMLYPFAWVATPGRRCAAAAGGCMLARRGALARIGGIAAIRDALIDDCALAARLKRHGGVRLDLAQRSVSLRPYDGWRSIWNMIARSAYTQLQHSPLYLLGTVLGMLATYAAPPALALGGWAAGAPAFALWGGAAAWLAMSALYAPMLRYYRRSLWWAPALPLVALFYLAATLASAWRYARGHGGQWKGRAQAPARR